MFLLDESAGLALGSGRDAARTLLVSGATFYLAWQAGTLLGLLGASVGGVQSVGAEVFPALFIGLAALSSSSLSTAARAGLAGTLAAGARVGCGGHRGRGGTSRS